MRYLSGLWLRYFETDASIWFLSATDQRLDKDAAHALCSFIIKHCTDTSGSSQLLPCCNVNIHCTPTPSVQTQVYALASISCHIKAFTMPTLAASINLNLQLFTGVLFSMVVSPCLINDLQDNIVHGLRSLKDIQNLWFQINFSESEMDSGLKQSCPVGEAMLLLTFCQRREEIWGALSWWSGPTLQEAARSPHPGTHQYRPGGPVCPSPYRQCHGRPEERQRATRQWSVRKTCQSMVCVTGQWPVSTATQMQHQSQVKRRRIHVLYLFSLTTRKLALFFS